MSITTYTPLEPSITSGFGLPPTTFQAGQASSLFASTSFIYSFLIILCVGATAFVYARGGLWRMQASEAGIRKSNEEFKRGTLGLLGVLSLFLILYTFNRNLLLGDIRLSDLKSSQVSTPIGQGGTAGGGGATGSFKPSITDTAWLNAINSDPTVRNQLKNLGNGGITVNKPVCSNPAQTDCTTVGGLPDSTIAVLTQLRSSCSGSIAITGGTENGHDAHGPGLTPVDISMNNQQLNACVGKFPAGPPYGWCNRTYTNFGYTFCDEKNSAAHWHMFK